jgi:hypothetical protein
LQRGPKVLHSRFGRPAESSKLISLRVLPNDDRTIARDSAAAKIGAAAGSAFGMRLTSV